MPYTPPTQRSPASSVPASPDLSRRSSFQSGSRPALPRSASYLSKHRRTPSVSAVNDGSAAPLTPQTTSDDLPSMAATSTSSGSVSGSVRQSPPPRTDKRGMPKGALISPPESASSGSDDESGTPKSRGRKLDRLKDLREAVSQIPQARTPSPQAKSNGLDEQRQPPTLSISFSTSALDGLSSSGRKVSHTRSATEPNASGIKSADSSLTGSEEDTDEDLKKKPLMVRKKSGELVRPALRPPSRRRPSSMPGTPIFSKAVHFDSHLEHVRHFLQVDRPLAVSAGSSPVDTYESESEFPFNGDSRPDTRSPPHEWEIVTSNFPHDSASRPALPVKLEKVWLSQDQKSMLGSIDVANLAFRKHVTCRFTLDYWKTTSEVVAEYSHEIRPKQTPVSHDRFTFSIKLSDTISLESKTLFFCIRYSVNGQEYWDNNTLSNFQVDFKKKYLPQNGKNNFTGAVSRSSNGLPRSNRTQSPSSTPRPKSMPSVTDEFGSQASKLKFDQSIHDYLGESGTTGLRLKTRSSNNLASDNLTKGLSSPSGVAFANRYDFGASLSAAVQAAKDSMVKDKDTLYMKSNVRGEPTSSGTPPNDSPEVGGSPQGLGTSSPNLGLPSSSYEELVNKYCFYGSKQSSPNIEDGTMRSGRFDGTGGSDAEKTGTSSPKVVAAPTTHHVGHAMSHAVHLYGSNPYFKSASSPTSHAASPLGSLSPALDMSRSSTPKSAPATVRSSSPAYLSLTPSSHENAFHAEQHLLPERFAWAAESCTPTAIRS